MLLHIEIIIWMGRGFKWICLRIGWRYPCPEDFIEGRSALDAAGTGFDKIIEEYEDTDKAHKPYIYSLSDHFTLVLPDLTYAGGVENGSMPVLMFVPVPGGTELDEKVLSFCYYQAHKVSEIAEYLGISDSTYLRKQVLGNLEANGYLERSKISRAGRGPVLSSRIASRSAQAPFLCLS